MSITQPSQNSLDSFAKPKGPTDTVLGQIITAAEEAEANLLNSSRMVPSVAEHIIPKATLVSDNSGKYFHFAANMGAVESSLATA